MLGQMKMLETLVPLVNRKETELNAPRPVASFSPTRGEKLESDHAIDEYAYLACAARIAIALGATSFSNLVATSSRSRAAAMVG